jgi:hypothetical protein
MNALEVQVDTLNAKMDGLHQIIEKLSHNLAQVLAEANGSPNQSSQATLLSGDRYSYHAYRAADMFMEHKDVLSDHANLDNMTHGGEKSFSPEIQIQRLTAQLTAAYNRIAALEEQLLAQRVH